MASTPAPAAGKREAQRVNSIEAKLAARSFSNIVWRSSVSGSPSTTRGQTDVAASSSKIIWRVSSCGGATVGPTASSRDSSVYATSLSTTANEHRHAASYNSGKAPQLDDRQLSFSSLCFEGADKDDTAFDDVLTVSFGDDRPRSTHADHLKLAHDFKKLSMREQTQSTHASLPDRQRSDRGGGINDESESIDETRRLCRVFRVESWMQKT